MLALKHSRTRVPTGEVGAADAFNRPPVGIGPDPDLAGLVQSPAHCPPGLGRVTNAWRCWL
ncbi:hypothetical protein KVR01_005172 [Diaporthe batatas]|uniref:uncharacterized protein n=1 Tax=Diaporthe batatas TaxID=748121 RepID=UPI001D059D87|nr:uncharacterized protein KVR01_005172 [Diaporthe batatas]KAG8164897.1 hypothetical protein KVR01_005172 [Diaporthe batatas]